MSQIMNTKSEHRKKWVEIIKFAESRVMQTDIKAAQLRALVVRLKAQRAAGEPSPIEVAELAAKPERRVGF